MGHKTSGGDESGFSDVRKRFLEALLGGSASSAVGLTSSVASVDKLKDFYRHVVQPAMYDVGRMWESGAISVSQEHAASAIVSRVMAVLQSQFSRQQPSKGRAIVTATANEYHELGAWIVADMLELDGWEVRYLGANTPLVSLADIVVRLKPHLLAISVTMPFNVDAIRRFVADLRNDSKAEGVVVLVGGMAMNSSPDAWRKIGADGYAPDFESAIEYARKTWEGLPVEKRL